MSQAFLEKRKCFPWIRSHIGITGRENVDIQAKASLAIVQTYLSFLFPILNHLSINISSISAKLHEITVLVTHS